MDQAAGGPEDLDSISLVVWPLKRDVCTLCFLAVVSLLQQAISSCKLNSWASLKLVPTDGKQSVS